MIPALPLLPRFTTRIFVSLRLLSLCRLLVVLGGIATAAAGTDPAYAESLSRLPAYPQMQLSPDGKYLAYVVISAGGEAALVFRDLATQRQQAIELSPNHSLDAVGSDWGGLTWVNERRMMFRSAGGYWAVDVDGKDFIPLTGYARQLKDNRYINARLVVHTFGGLDRDWVLIEEFGRAAGETTSGWAMHAYPNLSRLNTRTGHASRVVENPGNVYRWLVDANGLARVGAISDGTRGRIVYREQEEESWHPIPSLGEEPGLMPLALDGAGKQMFATRLTAEGRRGLFLFDLDGKSPPKEIVSHTLYDVQGRTLMTRDRQFLGMTYTAEIPRTFWQDAGLESIQKAVDAALPERVNQVINFSDDLQSLLFHSSAAQHAGSYYLFDRAKGSLAKFADVRPWLEAMKLAPMYPIKVASRDGLTLHGYLTVPAGSKPRNLPTVVMPHGALGSRDGFGFDPAVQFLAGCGYAVLQINHRGSSGYGREFEEKGYREMGQGIQRDIEDASRWAIRSGLTTSDRLAIMGIGYGGYAAVMGVIQSPGLYRCAITISGVSDIPAVLENFAELSPASQEVNQRRFGDPQKDKASLRALSPAYLADRVSVPVLVVHRKDTAVIPYDQATRLVKALETAKKPHEFVSLTADSDPMAQQKARADLYRRIELFLSAHLTAKSASN